MKISTLLKSLLLLLAVNAFTARAQLADIAVDGGVFSAAFSPAVTDYNVNVPDGTTSVNVVAVPANTATIIAGTGSVDVSSGSGVASIVVTAADESVVTYTVTITVDAATTLGYTVAAPVEAMLSGGLTFTVPDYTVANWTGDAGATLTQYPAVADVVTLAGENTFILKADIGGVIETKLLTVNLSIDPANGPVWDGSESDEFYNADNWSSASFSSYKNYFIGAGDHATVFTGNPANYSKHYIANGGELFITKGKLTSDRFYMREGAELTVSETGELYVYKSFELKGATATIGKGVKATYRAGRISFVNLYSGQYQPAVFNIFGGTTNLTEYLVDVDPNSEINLKDGGFASFSGKDKIIELATAGVLKPVDNSLLAFDTTNWVSAVSLELPEMRYGALDSDGNFTVPDFAPMYVVGDSIHNITYTQSPAAGEVITAAGDVIVTISATDYFGNTASFQTTLKVVAEAVWRGDYSKEFGDSANWEGVWPLAAYVDVILEKTSAESFDPHYTGSPKDLRYGALVVMPGNTLYIDGSVFYPNDPYKMYKGSSVVIDGGAINNRESNSSSIDNGTFTLTENNTGIVFDGKKAFKLAPDAGDEVTINIMGGEAWLGGVSFGDGDTHINLGAKGTALFNDSARIASAISSGVVSAVDSVILVTTSNYSTVFGAKVMAPEDQRGLIDAEGKFVVVDYTALATISAEGDNTITIEQLPAVGASILTTGEQTLTFTATDEWGNTSVDSCVLTVIGYDVYCPGDTTITDQNPTDSVVIPDFTSDVELLGLWKGEVTLSQFPIAGSNVALDSIFEVTISAVDTASNMSSCVL